MKIVMLEAASLGEDLDFSGFAKYGELVIYGKTTREQCPERIREADVILANKLMLDQGTLGQAENLKLTCVTATGVNNVDLDYAKSRGIGVANVAGYSTASVAQHTFALYFYVAEKLRYFDEYVKSGAYAASDTFSNLKEPFSQLEGKTWGIIGLGAIGTRVAALAEAFGCRAVYYSSSGADRNPRYQRLELSELLRDSDVVSVHAPSDPGHREAVYLRAVLPDEALRCLYQCGTGGPLWMSPGCCGPWKKKRSPPRLWTCWKKSLWRRTIPC